MLYVFFDIEAMQLQGSHEANLLVAETSEDDEPHVFEGSSCVREFLDWLEELTEEDTRLVTVIAHNFQGYDGYFVVHDYYGQIQIIQQLRNGAKLLEVKHDNVRFIFVRITCKLSMKIPLGNSINFIPFYSILFY